MKKVEERDLIDLLIRAKVIWPGFVGQVVLHVAQGPALCDIERHTKGLKRLFCNGGIDVEYELNGKGGIEHG